MEQTISSTMQQTATATANGTESLRLLFERQQAYHPAVAAADAATRIEKIARLRDAILRYRNEIKAAMYADFRKGPEETDLSEILIIKKEADFAIRNLKSWIRSCKISTPLVLLGTRSYVLREPKGVCLIMSPWNFPFNLTFAPLVSAIAAGNCVILKPSELTPRCSALMSRIVRELFDPAEIALVEGDASVSQELLRLPFNHIYFTGSSAIGKIVMRAAAEHLASVTLELGGKSPVIVDHTADLDDAAAKIAWTKFMNAGQTCIAPDYILADERIHDKLVAALKNKIEQQLGKTPDAQRESRSFCRIVNQRHFTRVRNITEESIRQGARVVMGASFDESQNFVAPTILTNVRADMPVMQEEIFGPVLPVIPFRSIVDACQSIRQGEKPLALYVFSKRRDSIQLVLRNTSSGGVTINDCEVHFFNLELPFGGINNSGIGKSKGKAGFLEFTNEKGVLVQKLGRTSPLTYFHPPYTKLTQRLLDIVIKRL